MNSDIHINIPTANYVNSLPPTGINGEYYMNKTDGLIYKYDGTSFVNVITLFEGGGASSNIYTNDGTINTNRIVDLDTKSLKFDDGKVSINTNITDPDATFEVKDFIKFRTPNAEQSTYIGHRAGEGATPTTLGNTALGRQALRDGGLNGDNTAIGLNALATVTGNDNTAVGADPLTNAGAASSGNSVLGSAILNNTSGFPVYNNSLLGVNAMTNGRGNTNCGMGFEVMKNAINSNNNVVIGSEGLINITTGGANVALGHQVARTLTEALQCIIIGAGAEPVSPIANNQLNIGSTIWGTDINNNGTNAKIGISINAPEQRLHVNGKIKVGDDANTATVGSIRYNAVTDKFQGFTSGSGWVDLH